MSSQYTIKIINPKNGAKFLAGSNLTIEWQYARPVNIYYRRGLLGEKILIANRVEGDFYLWELPDESIPDVILSIVDYNEEEVYSVATVRISIHRGASFNPYFPKVLHGSAEPYFEIKNARGEVVTAFETERPLSLIESWHPEIIVHKLFNGRKKIIIKGFWYECELDFSAYSKKEMLFYFGDLFNNFRYAYDGRMHKPSIVFYPRGYDFQKGGNPHYCYYVEIDPESVIELQQLQHRQGHKLFKLKLISVVRSDFIPFNLDSDLITGEMSKAVPYGIESGYGDTYGESYGDAL